MCIHLLLHSDFNEFSKSYIHLQFLTLTRVRSEGYRRCLVCVCVCVCVCVWGAKDQKEFGISVRKEKVKRLRGVCQHQ